MMDKEYNYTFTSLMLAVLFMRKQIEDDEFSYLVEMRVHVDGTGYFYQYGMERTFIIQDLHELNENEAN